MGAENPQLYKVMGLGDIDYSDFIPINILARGVPLLVANNDAPFNTFKEMVEYVQANPGEVKIGSTGPGGVPSVVTAMLTSQVELPMTAVPYDGDGPALTALMGGAIDVMPAVLGAAIEHVKAGRVKPIAIIDTERNPAAARRAGDRRGLSRISPSTCPGARSSASSSRRARPRRRWPSCRRPSRPPPSRTISSR